MEQWKAIPGYERIYEASNLGRIRTAEGKTTRNARCTKRVWKQRVLKQKWEKRVRGASRDARVNLWKDGVESTQLVARLVALAWCDGYADGLTVNHIDGDTRNNTARNLEWITIGDNVRKAFEAGLYPTKSVALQFDDGSICEFVSMSEASRALGKHSGYISNTLKKGRGNVLPGNIVVSF